MASSTSWGQRRALGRRYGIDPAQLYEQERLDKEYSLIPGWESRSLEERRIGINEYQFGKNLEETEKSRAASERAGYIGAGMGLAGNAALIRALTMEKGAPFFGFGKGTAAYEAAQAAKLGVSTGETATGLGMTAPSAYTFGNTITPAITDAGTLAPPSAFTFGNTVTAAPAAGEAGASLFPAWAAPAAAAYVGSRFIGKTVGDTSDFAHLRTPLTGAGGYASELLGNVTGVKEIGNVGRTLERAEETVASTIESGIGAVVNFIGSIFGW